MSTKMRIPRACRSDLRNLAAQQKQLAARQVRFSFLLTASIALFRARQHSQNRVQVGHAESATQSQRGKARPSCRAGLCTTCMPRSSCEAVQKATHTLCSGNSPVCRASDLTWTPRCASLVFDAWTLVCLAFRSVNSPSISIGSLPDVRLTQLRRGMATSLTTFARHSSSLPSHFRSSPLPRLGANLFIEECLLCLPAPFAEMSDSHAQLRQRVGRAWTLKASDSASTRSASRLAQPPHLWARSTSSLRVPLTPHKARALTICVCA